MLQKRGPKRKSNNAKCPHCNSSDVVAYSKVQKQGQTVQKYKCQNPECPKGQKNKTKGAYFTDEVEKVPKLSKSEQNAISFLFKIINSKVAEDSDLSCVYDKQIIEPGKNKTIKCYEPKLLICQKDAKTLEIIQIQGILDYTKQELRIVHRSRYNERGYRRLKKKHKKLKTYKYKPAQKYYNNFNNDDDLCREDYYENSLQYEKNIAGEDYYDSYDNEI